MQTFFSLSAHWRNYDIFARSKVSGFRSSLAAVDELASQYRSIVTELASSHSIRSIQNQDGLRKAEEVLFVEMCEICLWGNKTDLSLLPNLNDADIQQLQGSKVRKESEKKIIVNELSTAFHALSDAQSAGKQERRVDIILDNAGFELFVDLILAGYLLAADLATTVILHPKNMPWFVSDVTPTDFLDLVNALQGPQSFFGSATADQPAKELSQDQLANLTFLFENWSALHAEGKLILRPNTFWTEGGSFWRLPATAPELYADLKESELVIFKGDLNYRKLTADVSTLPMADNDVHDSSFGYLTKVSAAGNVGSDNAILDRSGTARLQVWSAASRAADLQGRCDCRSAAGKRRRAQTNRRRG
jgi:hypothetical protein